MAVYQEPKLRLDPYEERMRLRVESLFGVADFFSSNLRSFGHGAFDVHANNEPMHKAWARERGIGQMRTPPKIRRLGSGLTSPAKADCLRSPVGFPIVE